MQEGRDLNEAVAIACMSSFVQVADIVSVE